jgi:hypothetical protein
MKNENCVLSTISFDQIDSQYGTNIFEVKYFVAVGNILK